MKYIIICKTLQPSVIAQAYNVHLSQCFYVSPHIYFRLNSYINKNLIVLEEQEYSKDYVINENLKLNKDNFQHYYEILLERNKTREKEILLENENKEKLDKLRFDFIAPDMLSLVLNAGDKVLYRQKEIGNIEGIVALRDNQLYINNIKIEEFEENIFLGDVRLIEDKENLKYYKLSDLESLKLYEAKVPQLRGSFASVLMNASSN